MRKKFAGIALMILIFALCLAGCKDSRPKVSVTSISEIVGIGPVGTINRFSGVVEAGETANVEKDSEMEIKEISVSVGDAVSKGQVLFTYETDSLSIDIERMQLEVEQLNNSVSTKKSQITALEKEQKAAASADKLKYTLEIQQLELDVKETEFNVTSKNKEIERAKTRLAAASVLSPVSGHVKAINNGTSSYDPTTGQPLPFISITEEGDFRVKGTINEQNAMNLSEGTPVILRSRTDATLFWRGVVSMVDFENPVTDNQNYYYGPTDEMTTSSKYHFYVRMDGDEGLMLGQHLYIEPDNGQTQTDGGSDSFYLPSYYISDLDSDPWVWAASEKDKLEKRHVKLGNYNIDMDSYEIMEGLTLEDYIAYPDDSCSEGAPVRYPGEPMEFDEQMPEDGSDLGEFDTFVPEGEAAGEFVDDGWTDGFAPVEDAVPMAPEVAVVEGTEAVG